MARPAAEDIAEKLIAEAENMLAQTQGRRLVMSELAARVGISQPYAHRFFATKADLVRALAERWFAAVEAESTRIAATDLPPAERLEAWLLGILRLKRDRFDADPVLFRAYLDLAAEHMDIVTDHVARLGEDAAAILSELVPQNALPEARQVFEDATVLFRVPANIAAFRSRVSDERARAVVLAVIAGLGAGD